MIKYILGIVLVIGLALGGTYWFFKTATFSEGTRTGELIKFSKKGILIKTWEGELSQGISGAQIFKFSVEHEHDSVIKLLNEYNGKYVRLYYEERYRTFPWWGDTKYFIIDAKPEVSPFRR